MYGDTVGLWCSAGFDCAPATAREEDRKHARRGRRRAAPPKGDGHLACAPPLGSAVSLLLGACQRSLGGRRRRERRRVVRRRWRVRRERRRPARRRPVLGGTPALHPRGAQAAAPVSAGRARNLRRAQNLGRARNLGNLVFAHWVRLLSHRRRSARAALSSLSVGVGGSRRFDRVRVGLGLCMQPGVCGVWAVGCVGGMVGRAGKQRGLLRRRSRLFDGWGQAVGVVSCGGHAVGASCGGLVWRLV